MLGAAIVFGIASARRRRARTARSRALVARAWSALASGPVDVRVGVEPDRATEGDEVVLRSRHGAASRVPVGTAAVTCDVDRLGAFECRLRGHGRVADRRGRARRASARAVSLDEHVIERRRPARPRGEIAPARRGRRRAVVVPAARRARVACSATRADVSDDGRRLLLRRTAGFDLHSVREYEQGESLRRVHWPTSASGGISWSRSSRMRPRRVGRRPSRLRPGG